MRESLTILAILLIVVLTTALVGPYFVDWNAHRGAIEARLSQLLGARVTVGGGIDVKLLPRPIFRLADVSVVGPTPRAAAASAERLDVELALTALLRGEFVFVDADLTAPRLTLVRGADGGIVLPRFAATDPDHVSISHVSLRDGAVLVVDENGHPVAGATGLAGDGEAESLLGPFHFTGQVDTPRGAVGFRLNTGVIDADRVRLKGSADALAGLPRSEADGILTLATGAAGAAVPRFEGTMLAADSLPLAGTGLAIPWRLSGRLSAAAGGVDLSGLELRAGAEDRALVMNGDGRIDLGADAKASLRLRARQVDLPHLAVAPGSAETRAGAADAATVLAGLEALGGSAEPFAALPLPTTLDLGIEGVTLGKLTLAGLNGHLTLAPGAPLGGTLSVSAPDGSRVALDGSFEPGPAAVFKGRAEASTRDLGRLADSLAPDLPVQAAALRGLVPARNFAFNGVIDLSGIGFAARDADLTLDQSHFAGTITLTRQVGPDRARLFADLTSDALDLAALPDWRDTARGAADLDLSISLAARAVRLAQRDTGGVETGRVTLQLSKSGQAVTLDRLLLADLGGATADLSGRSDGHAAHLEGRLDAKRLRDLLALARRLAPGPMLDQLEDRADALSPALLKVAADAALEGGDGPRLTRATLDGTAAGTSVTLALAPAGGAPARFDATLTLDAPEAGVLLRQVGLATLPATAIGRGRLEADARLDADFRPLDGGLSATLGDTVLTLRGRGRDARDLSGRATVKGGNVAPLLRAVMLASPEAGAAWPLEAAADLAVHGDRIDLANLSGRALGAAVKGTLAYQFPPPDKPATAGTAGAEGTPSGLTGALAIDRLPLSALAGLALGPLPAPRPGAAWTDAAFTPGFASLPHADLTLDLAAMPLTPAATASAARLTLKLDRGTVTLADLSARLGEGRIGGTIELRRNGGAASLSGHAAWSDLPSASPAFGGRSRGALDLAGSGNSLAALVASLGGGGTIGVDEARLPRFDITALTRAVADRSDTSIDDSAIRQSITADLDKGAAGLGPVSTPVTLAAGSLRADPVTSATPAARVTAKGSLDLRSLQLALTTTAVLLAPPRDWVGSPPQVTVSWSGPFSTPSREVDATALVNGLAGRAIARDQARIEAFQEDVRERAFFARRLRQIEAEQQAARDKAQTEAQFQKLLQPAPVVGAPVIPTAPARGTRPGAVRAPLDLSPRALQPTP